MREARKLFAKYGYESTSINDVATRARVTKGALYHQFDDKRDLFDAVFKARVQEIIRESRGESAQRMDRLGLSKYQVSRYLAGFEILIDSLCEPASRRILLIDGPVVLGRARWQELWGEPMRFLLDTTFVHSDISPHLIEPLTHMLYGALQEMALAIGEADDPTTAKEHFGAAAQWVVRKLLPPDSDDGARK
jgi:AcrR family transcriptional regulator